MKTKKPFKNEKQFDSWYDTNLICTQIVSKLFKLKKNDKLNVVIGDNPKAKPKFVYKRIK